MYFTIDIHGPQMIHPTNFCNEMYHVEVEMLDFMDILLQQLNGWPLNLVQIFSG